MLRRIIFVTAAVVFLLAAATILLWRRVVPFSDGTIGYLPASTKAYLHLNLSHSERRSIAASLTTYRDVIDDAVVDALRRAALSREVRELGLVWYEPEDHHPIIAVLIGQRASDREDVVPPVTARIGEHDIRLYVVRLRPGDAARHEELEVALRSFRQFPVQAGVIPRQVFSTALEEVVRQFPAIIALGGSFDRRGVALRSDRSSRVGMRLRELFGAHRQLVFGKERTLAFTALPTQKALDVVTQGRPALVPLAPSIPATLDGVMTIDAPPAFAIRLPHIAGDVPTAALRKLAALLWPVERHQVLDGIAGMVFVADPSDIVLQYDEASEAEAWIVRSAARAASIAWIAASNDGWWVTTSNERLPVETSLSNASVRARCLPGLDGEDGVDIVVTTMIHPQFAVIGSASSSGSVFALCGEVRSQ